MKTVAAAASTASTVRIQLILPAETAMHYEMLAALANIPLEDIIVSHLTKTKEFTADNPIYFDDTKADELRRLLGGSISTPAKVIDMVTRLKTTKIGGRKIKISAVRQEALQWLTKSMGLPEDQAYELAMDQALGMLLKC